MKARSYLTLLLLLLGVTAWGQTYKLVQVTSVDDKGMYVFEQDGYVMSNEVDKNKALQTTNNFKKTGLTGKEAYVWKLESSSGGFYMYNCGRDSKNYLANNDSDYKTYLSFDSKKASKSIWSFSFQTDRTVVIQNRENDYRFLGFMDNSHSYKAYATENLDVYPHAIRVYKLIEKATKLYIHTGRDDVNGDWKPYIWAWEEGTTGVDVWGYDWFHKPQTNENDDETVNGIEWHTIMVPSDDFNLILHNGLETTMNQTPTISGITSDTFILFNLGEGSGVDKRDGNMDYVIVDFADITAENIYLLPDETADNVVRNNNSAGVTLSYDNGNPSVATYNESTNQVTGLSHGTAIVTVSWPVTRTDDVHRGWVNGSTSFEVYVARSLELKEGEDNATAIGDNQNERLTVNLTRQLTADMWNAICLPFSMDASQMAALFGEGFRLRSFSEVEKDGANVTLKFAEATTLEAGVPYIVLPTKTVESNAVAVVSDVKLTSTQQVVTKTADGKEYTFQGIYAPTSFAANDKSIRFIGSGNKFYYPNSPNPMRAFRAYFKLPAGTTEAKVGMSFDEDMGVATGIVAVDGGAVDGRIYSMSGQYVGTSTQGLPRGLYIRDGRKFVVK